MPIAEYVKHSKLLPTVNVRDIESRIGLFDFIAVNGSGEPTLDREESYDICGPWLVLAKTGPVTYKIQRYLQADPEIVDVVRLMPYYPDFGEQLHSWIETDCPMQYRNQETQTFKPVLQDQELVMVDIPSPMHNPVDTPPPMPDPDPVAEIAESHTDIPSTT